jgi:16S rRNA processing protein RimM
MNAAEIFRGADLWIPAGDRGALPEGDFFESDLVGCAVIDRATGCRLGVVDGWRHYGGAPLMALSVGAREVLVPFVNSLCQVDLMAREIRVDLPEGLLGL